MIRYIIAIIAFGSFCSLSFGQVQKNTFKPDFFEESLYLHVVESSTPEKAPLHIRYLSNKEKEISENLVDYPYQSDINIQAVAELENKATVLALAKRYIKAKEFKNAKEILSNLSFSDLDEKNQAVYQFYNGYLNFVHKDFEKARKIFDTAESLKGEYKFESLYYSAFCDMFLGEHESSFEKFSKLQNQSKYQTDLPYYMALMKYQQNSFAEVIQILKNELSQSQSIYEDGMRELLSRAYYKESKWDQLSDVLLSDENCCKTPEEHYFVGLSLYKRGKAEGAIPHLTASTK